MTTRAGSRPAQETPRGEARFGFAFRVAAEDHPGDAESGIGRDQLEDGAPASDLDVIRVRAEAQHFPNLLARLTET